MKVKEKLKAIRLKKLPEGSVEFKDKLIDTSACKSMASTFLHGVQLLTNSICFYDAVTLSLLVLNCKVFS